jgi:mxaD protein
MAGFRPTWLRLPTFNSYEERGFFMTEVKMKTTINASPEKAWDVVGDFNGLPRFVAAVTRSIVEGSGVGAVRTLSLAGGGEIRERLEAFDPDGRTLKYSILDGPLPVKNYLSTIRVTPTQDGRTDISWSSTFEPSGAGEPEARQAIEGVYQLGFDGLHKLFG